MSKRKLKNASQYSFEEFVSRILRVPKKAVHRLRAKDQRAAGKSRTTRRQG